MEWGNDDATGSDYFVFTQQGFDFSTSLEGSHGGLHAINRPIDVGVAVALVALGTTVIQHREVSPPYSVAVITQSLLFDE